MMNDNEFDIMAEELEVHDLNQEGEKIEGIEENAIEALFDLDVEHNHKRLDETTSVDVSFDPEGDSNERALKENVSVEVLSPLDGSFQEVKDVSNDKECGICSKTYKSKGALKRHVKVAHYEDVIRCRSCHKVFDTEVAMQTHIAENHSKNYICSDCGKAFGHKSHLNEHIKYKHSIQSEQLLNCPFENCGRMFVRKQVYQDHLNTHTNTKPYSCYKCKVCFTSRYAKRKHERLCIEGKHFKCHECDKQFTENRSLTYHIQGAHRPEIFVCVCGASYRYKPNLFRHRKQHSH